MNLKILIIAVFVLVYLYNLLLAVIHLRSADNPVPEETIVSESAPQEATPAEEAAPAPEQTADEYFQKHRHFSPEAVAAYSSAYHCSQDMDTYIKYHHSRTKQKLCHVNTAACMAC